VFFAFQPLLALSSSNVIIDAVRLGVLSVGLDTADGDAPDREDVSIAAFARSKTETFFFGFGVLSLARARPSRCLAFQRLRDLRCFLETFFVLLFGISTPCCVLDRFDDAIADIVHSLVHYGKFSTDAVKTLHALI